MVAAATAREEPPHACTRGCAELAVYAERRCKPCRRRQQCRGILVSSHAIGHALYALFSGALCLSKRVALRCLGLSSSIILLRQSCKLNTYLLDRGLFLPESALLMQVSFELYVDSLAQGYEAVFNSGSGVINVHASGQVELKLNLTIRHLYR